MESIGNLARRARMVGLSGNTQLAHDILDEAATMLPHSNNEEAAWIAIERGRLHNSAGDRTAALPYFLDAWEIARQAGDHDLAVDAAHMLAIASELADAERWTQTAMDYVQANQTGRHWAGMLYHNLGWTYYENGRFEQALACFRNDEIIQADRGIAQTLKVARYAIVKTLRAMDRLDEAIALGESVVSEAEAAGDKAPFVCEELAECHHAKGDHAKAATFAIKAHHMLSGNPAFVRDEPVRLVRLALLAQGEAENLGEQTCFDCRAE